MEMDCNFQVLPVYFGEIAAKPIIVYSSWEKSLIFSFRCWSTSNYMLEKEVL